MGMILSEGINEVIATTRNNAAPMGIICREGLHMVLFSGSHTAQNVERHGWLVANFVFDPVLYVRTAFEDLPAEEYVEMDVAGTAMHRLREVEAYIACSAAIERRTEDRVLVSLRIQEEKILAPHLHPVNRGFNSIVEATVHATRYVRSHDPALKDLITHHAGLVRKCGGRREWQALEMLLSCLEKNEHH